MFHLWYRPLKYCSLFSHIFISCCRRLSWNWMRTRKTWTTKNLHPWKLMDGTQKWRWMEDYFLGKFSENSLLKYPLVPGGNMIWVSPFDTNIWYWVEVEFTWKIYLAGGNLNIFYFHPYLGKWSNLTNIFQVGWNHQLVFLFKQVFLRFCVNFPGCTCT